MPATIHALPSMYFEQIMSLAEKIERTPIINTRTNRVEFKHPILDGYEQVYRDEWLGDYGRGAA